MNPVLLYYLLAGIALGYAGTAVIRRRRNAKKRHEPWCVWWQTYNEAGDCSCGGNSA